MSQATLDALAAMKAAQAQNSEDLAKNFTQPGSATTGLQAYNLEAPSKKLFPILTPLRNTLPRVGGGFATQANWKSVTNINVANQRAGVSEGNRGGTIQHVLAENFAAFRGIGLENNVTFEADYASKGFEDVKALAVSTTLQALMVQEERLLLGGNTSVFLGTTPTPTLTASATGGTLNLTNLNVICVALGLQAYLDVIGANNGGIGQSFVSTSTVPGSIVRTNADGSVDTFGGGSARKSVSAAVAVTGPTASVAATVTAVNGAVGYAWYWGATAGTELLGAVTSINSVNITATAFGTQNASVLSAADNSTSTLDFDGLLTQAFKPASGAYIKVMASGVAGVGTALTSDGAGGIAEFEEAFANFYNKSRLSPSKIYVSATDLISITKKIIGNGGAPLLKINADINSQTRGIAAGVVIGSYWNKVVGQEVPIVVHPNMPAGTVFFFTESLPYAVSGIPNVAQVLTRKEYYQVEWPLRTRKYEYGVYADEVLQHYAPFSMGVITNIAS